MADKISVIIPVYNVEKYLCKCLDSVVGQTYKNIEIILVDNKSTDKSGKICDEYALKDERIKVIHHEVNMGQSVSRNDGIDNSTGKWMMFIDSDDWIDSDFIEKMVQALPEEETDILVGGGHIMEYPDFSETLCAFSENRIVTDSTEKNFYIAKDFAPYIGMKRGSKYITISGAWSKLFRTSFVNDKGLRFNTSFTPNEDVLFVAESFAKAKMIAVSTIIGYHYLQNQGSSLHRFNSNWPNVAETFLNLLDKEFSELTNDNLLENALEIRSMICMNQVMRGYFFHKDNRLTLSELKDGIDQLKKIPLVARTIKSNNNKHFTRRLFAIKYMLRFPGIFSLRILAKILY